MQDQSLRLDNIMSKRNFELLKLELKSFIGKNWNRLFFSDKLKKYMKITIS